MDWIEKLTQLSQRAASTLRVKGALTPILWGTVLLTPTLVGATYIFRDQPALQWFFAILAALPILTTCTGFMYFVIKAPEKLQSETYQIRHETLQIIQSKAASVSLKPTLLEALISESRKEIEAKGEEVV